MRRLSAVAIVMVLSSLVAHAAAKDKGKCNTPNQGENALFFDVYVTRDNADLTSPANGGLLIERPIIAERPPTNEHIFSPNKALTFYICDPDQLVTSVEIDGTPTLPGRVLAPPPAAPVPGVLPPAVPFTNAYVFGPRTASAKVTITAAGFARKYDDTKKEVDVPAGTNATTTLITDVAIDQEYAGAFRLGVALFYGGADYKYGFQPSGDGGVITDESSSNFSTDIVAAYTGFIKQPRKSNPQYAACGPTIGLGLVSSSADKVQLVKSLFTGFDFEWNGVSAAFLLGLRRATRLGEQQTVGQYVATSGDISSRQIVVPAGGVSLNFSPDLFTIAAKGAGTP